MQFNPENRPGIFQKKITVTTENETLKLTIKGNVIPTPNKLRSVIGKLKTKTRNIALGKVFKGNIVIDTLAIQNTYQRAIKLSFDYDSTYIKIISEPEVIKPEERGNIITTFDTSKQDKYGHLTIPNKICFTSLNGTFKHEDKLSILIKIEEDFSKLTQFEKKNKPQIHFSDYLKELKLNRKNIPDRIFFEFSNKGKRDLIIRSINPTKGCSVGKYDKKAAPGESGKIEIILDKELTGRPFYRNINVITNDFKNPLKTLKIKGVK